MNSTETIAFVGNGNVGQSIKDGLINYSNVYGPDNILSVHRNYFEKEYGEFLYPKKISDCKFIILAVKPKDAIETLDLLRGKVAENTIFISIVSGLGTDIISKMLSIDHKNIAKLTLNIDVSCGKGTVIYRAGENASKAVEDIFSPLSKKLIKKDSKKILDGTVYAGSGAAFVAKYTLLDSERNLDIPFHEYLENLTMSDIGIQRFITVMESTCDKIFYRHNYDSTIFESTLEALKMSCSSREDLANYIERVATTGGCTREGVDKFNSLGKVNDNLFLEIFYDINKKAKSFKGEIRQDFHLWQHQQMKMKSVYNFPKKIW